MELHPIRFDYPGDFDVMWQRRLPEFSCAANGVSLLMPYVEPYVARSVRSAVDQLAEPLRSEAQIYVRQEGQHHAQHRRFNDLVVERFSGLAWLERCMASTYSWLERRGSLHFGLAFAAGFETVAYAAARWVADNETEMLAGADETGSQLFLWHLAEEVEHKSVAIDVYRSLGGNKRTYVAAMVLSAVLLAVFAWLNTTTMLVATKRIFNPLAHLRLLKWTISFLFELLPTMVMSVFPSHHPSHLADPLMYDIWIREHRPTDTK
ncbi:MAG: putative metal-dependent hydrolase [Acidimicrobiales bacterium]|jgi:uncharacterized protein